MKKVLFYTVICVCTLANTLSLWSQEADDGFIVPLNENFTKIQASPVSNVAPPVSNIKQGVWIEVTSDNKALIRDIAKGSKKGYEMDNSHLLSNMNWWFWGDINNKFQLNAEIAVWDFDKTLYQANTYASNVPDVTWGDGLQNVSSMFFAPAKEGNNNEVGKFNKVGFNISSPYVNFRIGYGNLKENGMTEFTGIYTTIDRWLDVGDGYLEVSNGNSLKKAGNWNINAVAALSEMRNVQGQPYGTYELLNLNYMDKLQLAFTFGSSTTQEELFYYNKDNINAASVYAKYNLTSGISFEAHGLGTFGTDVDFDSDAVATSVRVKSTGDKNSLSLMGSYAAKNVNSVWGSDGQSYDDINADTITCELSAYYQITDAFKAGFDESVTLNNTKKLNEGLMTFRTQPQFALDFAEMCSKNMLLSAYSVFDVDRLDKENYAEQKLVPYFSEAGFEFSAGNILNVKKITFDYAIKGLYSDNETLDGYIWNKIYNSVMFSADLNDKTNIHLGSLFNLQKEDDDAVIPFGIAFGFSVKSINLPGKPMIWMHFTYAMNPYEDNNYTLYRADDPQNKLQHKSYLLNSVETENASHIALGLIWNL